MNSTTLYQGVEQVNAGAQESFLLAKHDMNFFASLALPLVTEYEYPPLYQETWKILTDYSLKHRDFSKFAIGLPRGFAKTSVIKLFVVWCILYSHKRFFCILASTATHAQNIVADICSILDEPNIIAIFGNWRNNLDVDNKETKKFAFRGRTVIITSIGQGGSVRGLNIDNTRPDLMLFDDIQTREDADSEVVSKAIETWMIGTAMKAASHKGCLYIFLANMYPTPHSILRKLKNNAQWIKIIVGGILANGTSLWEALKPITQLLSEYESDKASGHPEIFKAEVLNDEEANTNTTIDLNDIPEYPFGDDEISAGNYIIIDPSNDKANSDYVSIGLFQVINGFPVLRKLVEDRLSPSDTITTALKMAFDNQASVIFVEANAYQYSLCHWFEKAIASLDAHGIIIQDIYSGGRSKNSRILEMFKQLTGAADIFIHPEVKAAVYNQISAFNALKTNNVDGILDLLTYAPRALAEFGHLISINAPTEDNFSAPHEASAIEETCSF